MRASHAQGLADEVHFPTTTDGWRLALHRYRPLGTQGTLPVILCGGYSCNRYFLDYDERHSLARFLARGGFDAWVLELRGRGLSRPAAACARPRSWTFDDLARFDAPAATEYVASVTGRAVAWIGHSMGGMLLYAYLATQVDRPHPLAAGVTIASPIVFPRLTSDLAARLGRWLLSLPLSETIHQRRLLTGLWRFLRHPRALRIGMNPANVDRDVIGHALGLAIGDVPRLKLRQLCGWALEGAFCSADGATDYRAPLRRVFTPLLVVAGSGDRLATPEAVRKALDYLPAPPSAYAEFGQAHGHSADYGHVDLILGRNSSAEVFPTLASWLSEVTSARAATAAGRQ